VRYHFGHFQVDDEAFELCTGGSAIALEPKAFQLLLYCVRHPNRLLRKQELLDQVWSDATVGENALTRCVAQIRKALEEDSRDPRYIATVPTLGYRFLAPVSVAPLDSAETATTPPRSRFSLPLVLASQRRSLRFVLAAAGILLAVVVVRGAEHRVSAHRLTDASPIRSLAVLPFDNLSGDPAQAYFAAGTTEELATELARVPGLEVIARSTSFDGPGKRPALDEIASDLHVDALVVGSVQRSGAQVRINASLIDGHTQRSLWASSCEGSADEMLTLEADAAREITAHARLASYSPAAVATRTVNPVAHDFYLRGLYYYHQREALRSVESFQQAIDADPLYASAYAGLALSLNTAATLMVIPVQDAIPRATAAARKAIELDPRNGEAYLALGAIETSFLWDWADGRHNLELGNQLSPNNSVGEMLYAFSMESAGHTDETVWEMQRALSHDPLSFFMVRQYATSLYFDRHYDEALEQLERAREMHPGPPNLVDNWESWIYEKKGLNDRVVQHDLLFLQAKLSAEQLASLRQVYAGHGWEAYWRLRLRLLSSADHRNCDVYDAGVIETRLGDFDQAFRALHSAVEERCFWVSYLRVDPKLDPLRTDPRFQTLLHEANLTEP
jgi:TolB-like protein/DNA-binding winged helix-turn-helix (wHTH) protein